MKAPMVIPTGCPCCGSGGIPGTACAPCLRRAYQTWIGAASSAWVQARRQYGAASDAAKLIREEHERRRATLAGADLLLDTLGVLLVRVGFELPDVVEVRR